MVSRGDQFDSARKSDSHLKNQCLPYCLGRRRRKTIALDLEHGNNHHASDFVQFRESYWGIHCALNSTKYQRSFRRLTLCVPCILSDRDQSEGNSADFSVFGLWNAFCVARPILNHFLPPVSPYCPLSGTSLPTFSNVTRRPFHEALEDSQDSSGLALRFWRDPWHFNNFVKAPLGTKGLSAESTFMNAFLANYAVFSVSLQ